MEQEIDHTIAILDGIFINLYKYFVIQAPVYKMADIQRTSITDEMCIINVTHINDPVDFYCQVVNDRKF
jgi:hypothetical protein